MTFLVKRAMKGDARAFVELMESEKTGMYKVACCYLSSEADRADAMQETVLTCWEKLATLKQAKHFRTWMIRILINKCLDICRSNQIRGQMEDIDEVQAASYDENLTEFWDVMNRLEEKYRTILILYYVEGFKIREISQLLEMSENTVSTRLQRGKKRFQQIFAELML